MRPKQKVIIYKPAKTAMQSGNANSKRWFIKFLDDDKDNHFIDPLMGWHGSTNTQKQVRLSFNTQEEAVAFVERNGYEYKILPPKERATIIKSYADNFK